MQRIAWWAGRTREAVPLTRSPTDGPERPTPARHRVADGDRDALAASSTVMPVTYSRSAGRSSGTTRTPTTACRTSSSSPPLGWTGCANRTGYAAGCLRWLGIPVWPGSNGTVGFSRPRRRRRPRFDADPAAPARSTPTWRRWSTTPWVVSPRDGSCSIWPTGKGSRPTRSPACSVWPRPARHKVLVRARATARRSLGVALVARPARGLPCLAAVLGDWDGTLTPLLRKRVSRHIEHCSSARPKSSDWRRRSPARRRRRRRRPGRVAGRHPADRWPHPRASDREAGVRARCRGWRWCPGHRRRRPLDLR